MFRSVDDWQTTIVLLFNYRSELFVAHSVTVVSNFSQQIMKIALKLNETEFTTMWNGKSIFLKWKIIGPTFEPLEM